MYAFMTVRWPVNLVQVMGDAVRLARGPVPSSITVLAR